MIEEMVMSTQAMVITACDAAMPGGLYAGDVFPATGGMTRSKGDHHGKPNGLHRW